MSNDEALDRLLANQQSQFKPGDNILGIIEIVELVGEGATAFVWRARDIGLQQDRAVKELKPIFTRFEPIKHRLFGEARLMARLNHPNIVKVQNVLPDRCVIVMDWVEGCTLETELACNGPLDMDMTKRIALSMFDALISAHREYGVVHRDIKPANIMLEGPKKIVRITDFGIAVSDIGERRTRVDSKLGTPKYAAPEQFVDAANVDHRADQYSIGIVLYEMITGELVDLTKYGAWEKFQPGLPPQLAGTIKRITHPDREQRFPSHEEARDAIEKAFAKVNATPLLERSSHTIVPMPQVPEPDVFADPPQPERKPGRTWMPVAIGAAALLLGAVGVGAMITNAQEPPVDLPVVITTAPVDTPPPVVETPVTATKAAAVAAQPAVVEPTVEKPVIKQSVQKPEPAKPSVTASVTQEGGKAVISLKAELCTPTQVTVYYRAKGSTDAPYEPQQAKFNEAVGIWNAKIPVLTSGTEYFIDAKTSDAGRKRIGTAEAPSYIDP